MARDKKRAQEVEKMRSNVDMARQLDKLKSEMVSALANQGFMILYDFCSILFCILYGIYYLCA